MNPLRTSLRFAAYDAMAKGVGFFAVVYLARRLGSSSYGTLEFALSVLAYILLLGDGGLELWATRATARRQDLHDLAGRVIPLRLLLALGAYLILLLVTPALPDFSQLRSVVLLFGLTLFTQAASLKWAFMGQQWMGRAALGLLLANLTFAGLAVALIDRPEQVVWVPLLKLAGEVIMVVYFWYLFARKHGLLAIRPTLRGSAALWGPAVTLGSAQALGLLSFNFDSLALGYLRGSDDVGVYGAAYKLLLVGLALPVTYSAGLFASLSHSYARSSAGFRDVVGDSLRVMATFALPLGVCGVFLAEPMIHLVYGSAFAAAVPPFRLLVGAAVLVALRGTFRQALNASGRHVDDFRCGLIAVSLNVLLNLLLIPRLGIVGAAAATLASEVLWISCLAYCVVATIGRVEIFSAVAPAATAALLMATIFVVNHPFVWVGQLLVACTIYIGALAAFGQTSVLLRTLAKR